MTSSPRAFSVNSDLLFCLILGASLAVQPFWWDQFLQTQRICATKLFQFSEQQRLFVSPKTPDIVGAFLAKSHILSG